MQKSMVFKLMLIAVTITLLCSKTVSSSAGTLSGIGEKSLTSISSLVASATKSTDDWYSTLKLGDVAVYNSIQATTYSQGTDGFYAQSNPWTVCMENDTTYMGQYVTVTQYVGQGIKLYAKRSVNASTTHSAYFDTWEYR